LVAVRALVLGLGAAGESTARALQAHGYEVVAADDHPTDATHERAARLGLTLGEPSLDVDLVVPTPGVAYSHPVLEEAVRRGISVWTEFELAAQWTDTPMVAVTGTDGKTTVTTLIERMLSASGLRVVAAGNMDPPLVDVLDRELDVIVVEASSFRLHFTETFRPVVGLWLNLAPDHLDWHGTMEHYTEAKAKIWANQGPDDLAVANADDPVVMRQVRRAHARLETFGLRTGDWHMEGNRLMQPDGEVLLTSDELFRALPHDLTNALAASAAAFGAGATVDGVRDALRAFTGLPHRVSLVGDHEGVRYYDDSKATGPNAVLAALRAFDSVVLIAGGRSKVDDLSALASDIDRVRAVVAIGEAAPLVEAAFEGKRPVEVATTMDDAVARAKRLSRRGDAVLLSPGCASWDMYNGYAERGDDFARAVREMIGATT
jgi:UDP-N-acetylmuramoylalanine--D-glutamate ligase